MRPRSHAPKAGFPFFTTAPIVLRGLAFRAGIAYLSAAFRAGTERTEDGCTDPIRAHLREEGRYNLVWLARRTGYSHSHVKAMATGRYPTGPRFRAACAALLGLPERDLFHGTSSASAPGDSDGSDDRAGVAVGPRAYPHEEEVPIGQIA